MVKRTGNEESLSLDFSDLIYRSNLMIMENEAFGNQGAKYDVIEYMDRILAPFRDKQYTEEMNEISKIKKPTGRTPQACSEANKSYTELVMNKRHEVLMCLAFRNGFLGNKKPQSLTSTQIMEETPLE